MLQLVHFLANLIPVALKMLLKICVLNIQNLLDFDNYTDTVNLYFLLNILSTVLTF